ncbi:hypothetical protein [Bacteroides finegoldii]|uniref:hypothetical protein n=1 Tax=Bacteroides finegoldii TaxID=338188 RepID=UPI0032ED9991
MIRIIQILIISFFVGCVSNENVVLVKQIESTNSIVLRMKKDKNSIFSLSYPLSFKIKKTDNRDIYYAENSYLFHNKKLSSGTAACYLRTYDEDNCLTSSYKVFNGSILYIIDKNDTLQRNLSGYYQKMISEKKDTIHVSLKEFNRNFKENIINNFFEGDSISLHFHDRKRWIDVPLRVSFN